MTPTIIAGSRWITDYQALCRSIEISGFRITEVVSGTAKGVDTLGERWARERGIPIKQFVPDWQNHFLAAGPIRNGEMIEYIRPQGQVVLLWDGTSTGSADLLRKARLALPESHIYQELYHGK